MVDVAPWLDAAGHAIESVAASAGLVEYVTVFALFLTVVLVVMMLTEHAS